MAELFMECEEEELEPWQQKTKPIVEDDEDDEPIFVGEFLSAKPTNTYILNRVNPNSSRVGMQNGVPKRAGAVAVPSGFHGVSKPTMSTLAVHPQPRASNVSGAPQALQRPLSGCSSPQEGATSGSGTSQPVTQPATPQSALRNLPVASCAQPVSRPVATVTAQPVASDRVTSNKTSGLAFGGRQNSGGKPCQSGSPTNATGLSKRPATSEASSVTAKKVKANEADSERELSLLPLSKAPNDTSLIQKDVALSNFKNGASFPQACPKCNIHFNLLEPLKNHIKYCCPDMGISKMDCSGLAANTAESEKGKLIMLVNDFYYGKHEGNTQQVRQEQKTHTTFKCASCTKVLKSNLRFMNHMKHHLEVEKQNNESWESHTTCQHCYRQFPTPFQLQCHIESTHTPHESSTVCKICELSFETEQVLLQHMKDNHKPGEMPYVCQVCNYRSSVFSDVEKHFRAVHENTKNLLCPFCLKVIKIGAPYMHHFMRHQKKGVHRCTKCRLQFLTCKEKLDHKSQHHRTFKKPAQLEGLPPGTKVTIRASVGSLQPVSVMASPLSANASTLQLSPGTKEANGKTQSRCNARKTKSRLKLLNLQKNQMLSQNSSSGSTSSKKANKIANTALNNLRCPDIQKCIECYSDIRTFASHFPAYVRCSLCRYSTSCSKAYVNHMVCFHTARQNKRFWIYKAHAEELRGTTVVCLNCDFLTDVSGLDKMATHLNENHSHTCQVIVEKVPLDNLTAADFSDLAKDEEEKPEICTEPPTQKEQAEASISGSPQTTSPKETKVNIPEKQNNDSAFAEETKQLVPKNNFSPDFQAYSNNSAERGKTEGLGNQDMLVAECELKKSSILENISGPEPEACSEHCAEESGADKMKNQIQKDLLAVDGKGDDPLPATGDTSVSELHSCFTQELANQESASLSASENAGTVQVPGASCGLESASPKSPTGECLANRMGDDDAPDPEHNTCSGELPNSENTQDADCLTSQNQSDACSLVAKDEGNTSSGEEKFSALILSASSNGPADSADEPNKDKIEETNPTSPAPQCKENISVEEPVAELQAAPKISAAEKARDPLGNPTGVTEESSASSTVKNVSTSGLQASSAESSCEVSVPENNKANDDQSSVVQTKGTDWDEAQLADVNDETTELASGDDEVSFEQFLRRRGEPESAHSDASDQGSVHLEPLTPSEVLEHEATEILQKGAVPATSKKAGVGSEPADGPSGEDSPSQEEPSEGGDEAS